MKKLIIFLSFLCFACASQPQGPQAVNPSAKVSPKSR